MAIEFDPSPGFADYSHPEKFVSAQWLSAKLGTKGLKVVESDEDSLLYNIGHIPGAVRIDWHDDLNDPIQRDFIDGAAFAKLMDEKGISRDDTVVVYGDKSNWWAAYTLWVFELFGHPDVRILDGGRDAWTGEERDLSFDIPTYPASGYPVVERNDQDIRIFAEEIRQLIGTDPQLIDVRSPEEYSGETTETPDALNPATLRTGHIPGALNLPWGAAVQPNARFTTVEQIREAFADVDPSQDTITYCVLGDRSAHTWFVLKYILGFESVRNYDGSWAEWGNIVRAPVTRGLSQ